MSVISSRLALLGAGAVLFTAGIAGCGGGDDESTSAITQEEFVAQGNEFCTTFTTDSDASSADYDEAETSGDLDAAADAYAAIGEQMSELASNVEGLGAPEGDEDTLDEFVSAGQDLSDNAATAAEALRNEDIDGVAATNDEAGDLRSQFDQAAGDLGLTECEA